MLKLCRDLRQKGLVIVLNKEKLIRKCLAEILKERDVASISSEDNLTDYGLHSIEAISLVILLEDALGIELQDDDLLIANLNTISNIKNIISKYESTNV